MPTTESHNIPLDAILQPIETASGLPNQAYTSDEFMAYERDHVLGKSWAGLWFASDLPLTAGAVSAVSRLFPFVSSTNIYSLYVNETTLPEERLADKPAQLAGDADQARLSSRRLHQVC